MLRKSHLRQSWGTEHESVFSPTTPVSRARARQQDGRPAAGDIITFDVEEDPVKKGQMRAQRRQHGCLNPCPCRLLAFRLRLLTYGGSIHHLHIGTDPCSRSSPSLAASKPGVGV